MSKPLTPKKSGPRSACAPLPSALTTEDFETVSGSSTTSGRPRQYAFNEYFGGRSKALPVLPPDTRNSNSCDVVKQGAVFIWCLLYILHEIASDYVTAYYNDSPSKKSN